MKLALLVTELTFLTALLTGCATSNKYAIGSASAVAEPNVKVVDMRDASQKKAEVMAANIQDCWYGVYRLGDEQTEPDRLSYLAGALNARMGSELKGKAVRIDTFEMFNNWQSALSPSRGPRGSSGGGTPPGAAFGLTPPSSGPSIAGNAIGGAVVGALAATACRVNSPKLGIDQNPDNLPAIIVNIDMTVDGSRVQGTIVQLDPQGRDSTGRGPFVSERVKRSLERTVEFVVDGLRAGGVRPEVR